MKIGIYGLPHLYPERNPAVALSVGATAAGHSFRFRNPNPFTPDQVEDFDAVVLWGLRGRAKMINDEYRRTGKPTYVVDLGYVRRSDGYFQLGVGGLNWLPPGEFPDDRRLEQRLEPRSASSRGNSVLLLGQRETDAQHGLSQVDLLSYYGKLVRLIRTYTNRKIVFRHHPLTPMIVADADENVPPTIETLDQALDAAYCVVSINSTAAYEALLRGIPVFCEPGFAPYEEFAGTSIDQIEVSSPPNEEGLRRFFSRLAYAQWTISELRTGKPLNFVMQYS